MSADDPVFGEHPLDESGYPVPRQPLGLGRPLLTLATTPEREREREREFFIDNLLVRIYVIIVMIRWTSLAPGEF